MKKFLVIFSMLSIACLAKDTLKYPPETIKAVRINTQIEIDGILSESIWNEETSWCRSFTQKDPNEGEEPSEITYVKVLFDDEAIYIGARMFDSSPDSIVARLTRKDVDSNSDIFWVFLDPYNDKKKRLLLCHIRCRHLL